VWLESIPLTPALSLKGERGEREPIFMLFKPEFDSIFQVGVTLKNTAVSPLSPRERARVRGF
jgi:hypothetical protein